MLNVNYLLTYSMQQSPSETDRFSPTQAIPHISWYTKVHCHNHKYPPPVLILSQLDPVLVPTSHFLKIHLYSILPSTPGSSKWSLSFRFLHQIPVYTYSPLPHTCYMHHRASFAILQYICNSTLHVNITLIMIQGENIMRFSGERI